MMFPSSHRRMQQYRRHLENAGFIIEPDQDVVHIISEANGGANHPDNYAFVGNASWNRSIVEKFDHLNCYMAGKAKSEKAVAISKKIGNGKKLYDGESALELYKKGEAIMREIRHRRREEYQSPWV